MKKFCKRLLMASLLLHHSEAVKILKDKADTEITTHKNLPEPIIGKQLADEGNKKLDEHILTMMTNADKGWSCNMCGKFDKLKANIKTHIEAKHLEGGSHRCTQCGKEFKSRHSLRNHVYVRHTRNSLTVHGDKNICNKV